jgi:F0F1-type ATP synthase membrane subunit b/b'
LMPLQSSRATRMFNTLFRIIRNNWKETLIILCLLVTVGKMHLDYKRLENMHETMRTSLQDQIAGLQHIHEEELRQRDAALTAYKDQLDKIEKTYEKDLETIKADREKKYQEYLHRFIQDPEQLAKDVEALFGFEYVE